MNLVPNSNHSYSGVFPQKLSGEQLYLNYSGILYGVIKNTVKDTLAAEAILEQVFLKIHDGKNERASQISFLTWTIQQTLIVIKQYRNSQQFDNDDDLNKSVYISASKELRQTDDHCKHVFDLVLQGYNANEISDLLKMPLRTVIKNLRAGMKLKVGIN